MEFLIFQCYVGIFKQKAVCMGTTLSIPPLSSKFVIDTWGRPMYKFSKEHIFQLMYNFGVSQCFPGVLGNSYAQFVEVDKIIYAQYYNF